MKRQTTNLLAAALGAATILVAPVVQEAAAITYTVDTASATPAFGDDLLTDPFAVISVFGSGGTGIEVNGFSYGHPSVDASTVFFSVAPGSVGTAGTAVNGESTGFGGPALGDEPADVYSSSLGGTNTQVFDGDGIAAFPSTPGAPASPMGLSEPFSNNVDGIDLRSSPGGALFWTVDAATAGSSPTYSGMSSADVFLAAPSAFYSLFPGIYATSAALGLALTDDVNALVVVEDGLAGFSAATDTVYFSLAPGSPTLAGLGATPSDVLAVGAGFGAAPAVFAPAATLGLLPGDNLNALDFIPEPGSAFLLLVAVAVGALRRQRPRTAFPKAGS